MREHAIRFATACLVTTAFLLAAVSAPAAAATAAPDGSSTEGAGALTERTAGMTCTYVVFLCPSGLIGAAQDEATDCDGTADFPGTCA